ncbi:GNAT family N-acetyltransferase [Aquisediminimonas sediminicola]|uniref:GNAT family N-acetyltransferase n=1 Tax=Alteraquisediminimonas sediminicola TaxID=2676787 RepID=UPI001C8EA0D5|nr:GNAT family N-acetyltransferase [Aquisediminimonas sediminicola]
MALLVNYLRSVEALRVEAGHHLSRDAQISLFDRADWFQMLDRHFPAGEALRIAHVSDGKGAHCWLPLMIDKGKGAAWACWYSLKFQPIWAGTEDTGHRVTLLAAIARDLKRHCGTLSLYPVPTERGIADLIGTAFRLSGWIIDRADSAANWVADTKGLGFDAYWSARPSRLRNTVQRRAKQAMLDIHIHHKFQHDIWHYYEMIYAKSWKPTEGAPGFVRDMARAAGRDGSLRLGIAYHQQEAVACQLWTVDHQIAIIHKLSYAHHARAYSPGTLLSQAMFRHVLDQDQPHRIDFGTGDDAYKADWMDRKLPLARMTMAHPLRISGVLALAETALRRVARRVR